MKPASILLPACLFLFTFSCGKTEIEEGPISITGQVLARYGKGPMAHATVYLVRLNKEYVGALGMQTVAATQADGQGNYAFDFTAEREYSYFLSVLDNTWYFGVGEVRLNFAKDNRIKQDIYLHPKGWVRFDLVNEPPLDYMDFNLSNGGSYNGISRDTSVYMEYIGDEKLKVWWFMNKQTGYTRGQVDIYFPVLDTGSCTIRF